MLLGLMVMVCLVVGLGKYAKKSGVVKVAKETLSDDLADVRQSARVLIEDAKVFGKDFIEIAMYDAKDFYEKSMTKAKDYMEYLYEKLENLYYESKVYDIVEFIKHPVQSMIKRTKTYQAEVNRRMNAIDSWTKTEDKYMEERNKNYRLEVKLSNLQYRYARQEVGYDMALEELSALEAEYDKAVEAVEFLFDVIKDMKEDSAEVEETEEVEVDSVDVDYRVVVEPVALLNRPVNKVNKPKDIRIPKGIRRAI